MGRAYFALQENRGKSFQCCIFYCLSLSFIAEFEHFVNILLLSQFHFSYLFINLLIYYYFLHFSKHLIYLSYFLHCVMFFYHNIFINHNFHTFNHFQEINYDIICYFFYYFHYYNFFLNLLKFICQSFTNQYANHFLPLNQFLA